MKISLLPKVGTRGRSRPLFNANVRFLMKLNVALMAFMTASLQLAATNSNGQDVSEISVTIRMTNGSLEELINQIQQQTALSFGYTPDQAKEIGGITFNTEKLTVKQVLDQTFANSRLGYRQRKTVIAIYYKDRIPKGHATISNSNDVTYSLRVEGTVTDSKTGEKLPGVNVVVKNTTIGTTTASDGKWVLEVDDAEAILVFSSIGFLTFETPVGNRSVIDVPLETDLKTLSEVIVYSTGYDNVSAERTTGSFSQLDEKLLERNVGTDIISRLNGVTPSLLIDQRSGTKNFFNIRGTSTIMANDQPLIVVDNFPYSGDLNTINPNDIETITVLRDAAAASIWGVRAGNGVIVIATKSGKANAPQRVNINTNVTVGEPTDMFYRSVIATSDFIDVERSLFNNGYFDSILLDNVGNPRVSPVIEILNRQRNGEISEQEANSKIDEFRNNDSRKDLERYFYQRSVKQQYAINFSGGSPKHSYFVSAGYDNNRSTEVGDRSERITLNIQNKFNITSNLALDTRLVYANSSSIAKSNQGTFSNQLYRYTRLTDDEGNAIPITYDYRKDFVDNSPSKGFLDWTYNPIMELGRIKSNTDQNNFRGAVGLSYKFLDGLNADVKYQYESESVDRIDEASQDSYIARDFINKFSQTDGVTVTNRNIPIGAIRDVYQDKLISHNARVQLNFSRVVADRHRVNSLGGMEIREIMRDGYSSRQYGYDVKQGTFGVVNYASAYPIYPDGGYGYIPNGVTLTSTRDRFRSYFANLAYTFNEKYTLSASGRIDQSNLFGVKANQRSTPLWSIGGKWNGKVDLFANVNTVSEFSLRATYGYNGNIDQNTTAYTTALLGVTEFSQTPVARLVSPPNPDLKWERIRMLNLAVDFGFFENRVFGKIEHYRKRGMDLIGVGPLDPTLGFPSFRGNVASMRGYGLDVEVNTINTTGSIRWETNIFLSHVSDKVTQYKIDYPQISSVLTDPSISRNVSTYTPIVGRPLFSVYSLPWAGLDPTTGDPRGYLNGEPSNDYTGLFTNYTVDSLKFHGRAMPSIFGGFRNTISYKGLSLSINIVYRLGYYFRNESINYNLLYATGNGHSDYALRWKQPGDDKLTHVPSEIYPANPQRDYLYRSSSVLIEKADNIRLQDIRLSYDFGVKKIGAAILNQVQIYMYVNNIGVLWKTYGSKIDPDSPSMRPLRSLSAGAKISF
jgi:TonB-dependent starch-binding outer membrane protein SusC